MGSWSDAEDVRTLGVDDWLFDAAEAAIPPVLRLADGDPMVEASLTPHAIDLGTQTLPWPLALVLAPSIVAVAGRTGRFGRTSHVTTIARWDITHCDPPVRRGDGLVVPFLHTTLGECEATFGVFEEAEYLANFLTAGLAARTRTDRVRSPSRQRHRPPRVRTPDAATT